jgi:hypothetical protein
MLSEYIDNRIRSLPSEIRPKQTPLLNCSTSGKIILARITKTKTKASDEGKNLTENVSLADTAIIEALEYHTDGDYTNASNCRIFKISSPWHACKMLEHPCKWSDYTTPTKLPFEFVTILTECFEIF